ncbi:MAG: hypothetical protein ABL889_19610 [Terricaulis sp.]
MDDMDIVRKFVLEQGPHYISLLESVKTACIAAENEFGKAVVLRVYSRSAKQGGEELKSFRKIYSACVRPISSAQLKKIDDIIGVTIVVQYTDQIERVLAFVADRLTTQNIRQDGKLKPHTETYFATHARFISHSVAHRGLRCEVQCKTMLHDAWSAKMHDLTYKPQGNLDERIKALIESNSAALQHLEKQSEIIRDVILSRQSLEKRPFQASLEALYKGLLAAIEEQRGGFPKELESIRDKLEEQSEHLQRCPIDDQALHSISEEIASACENDALLRFAWLLAVRLAGFRTGATYSRFLEDQVERVWVHIEDWVAAKQFTERELGAIPLGFYCINAVAYAEKILALADSLKLSPTRRQYMRFNKATWLTEQECVQPTKAHVKAATEAEVRRLMAEVLADAPPDDDAIMDTEGLIDIVFGKTKEDVRRGIKKCNDALAISSPDDANVAEAYAEWRTQAGWRRYFDLAERL